MTAAFEADRLSRTYGRETALDEVTFQLPEGGIHGLLGRNGAGKTTMLRLLTGQELPTGGRVRLLGADPFENDPVLRLTCFVGEAATYPDVSVGQVLAAARLLLPFWDEDFAGSLVADFELPRGRRVKNLSRGMRSTLGIVIGLASRALLTLFDEPYLGLDASARQLFYDRLLADFAERPRTVLLSTHLIDEVANLLERVLVLDRGRLVLDADADALRGTAFTVTGPVQAVDRLLSRRTVVDREVVGGFTTATVSGSLDEADRRLAADLGLDLGPVSLQQLVMNARGEDR